MPVFLTLVTVKTTHRICIYVFYLQNQSLPRLSELPTRFVNENEYINEFFTKKSNWRVLNRNESMQKIRNMCWFSCAYKCLVLQTMLISLKFIFNTSSANIFHKIVLFSLTQARIMWQWYISLKLSSVCAQNCVKHWMGSIQTKNDSDC